MVRNAVNANTVKRLRKLAESHQGTPKKILRAKNFFKKLPILDHRVNPRPRVRLLKTKKGGIVIKIPEYSAKEDIVTVRRSVDWINQVEHASFKLLKPKAHVIGDYILMRRTRFPSISEMIGTKTVKFGKTDRGQRHLKRLAKENGVSIQEMEDQLVSAHDLLKGTAREMGILPNAPLYEIEGYTRRNILVLGKKEGKILFLPLLDPG